MTRISRKMADSRANTLNEMLGLPTECYLKDPVTDRYIAQIGCIHICAQNGTHNINQLSNESGGCKGLAYGLTIRECYDWFSAAIEGVRLAKENNI